MYVIGCKNLVVCENSGYLLNSLFNVFIIGWVWGINEYYCVDFCDRLDLWIGCELFCLFYYLK